MNFQKTILLCFLLFAWCTFVHAQPQVGKPYYIVNAASGRVLEIDAACRTVYNCDVTTGVKAPNRKNQKWMLNFKSKLEKIYEFANVGFDKALVLDDCEEVPLCRASSGIGIHSFYLVASGNGFLIEEAHSDYIPDYTGANFLGQQIWSKTGRMLREQLMSGRREIYSVAKNNLKDQLWIFQPADNGIVQTNPSSSKAGFSNPNYKPENTKIIDSNVIKAGAGWGKIAIGATQSQIETALGKPEKYYEGNVFLPDSSAHYFEKGIIVTYDRTTNLVKSISFIGDPVQLDNGSYAGTFRRTAALPDKNNGWGATVSAIVKSYGAPRKRLNETRKGREIVTLIYDQIVFTFAADKLYYISVAADNTRLFAALDKAQSKPIQKTEFPMMYSNIKSSASSSSNLARAK